MKNLFKLSLFTLSLMSIAGAATAQNKLESKTMSVEIGNDGIVKSMNYQGARGLTDVSFRKDDYLKGPSIFFNENRLNSTKQSEKDGTLTYTGKNDSISYELKYFLEGESFVVEATVKNLLSTTLTDQTITLKPGIDTELEEYPSWNNIFFPTLLRCEKTHFWGYLLNGMGDVLAIGSKDPVASWQMEYYLPEHWRGKGGHLIFSYRMDLMHKAPLPARHPQNLNVLAAGESKTWRVYLTPVAELDDVKPTLAATLGTPMLDAEEYTKRPGDSQVVVVNSVSQPSATLKSATGKAKKLRARKTAENTYEINCQLGEEIGTYTLDVSDKAGHTSQAILSTRNPYSWYMDKARSAAVFNTQYAGSHLENWLGLHSGLLARKYTQNAEEDASIEERLNIILSLQWDETTGVPKFMYEMRKLANTAQMVSVLVDAYEATENMKYLEKARQLATIVMAFQEENGDYLDYTAIFYPAKSMMELVLAEKELRHLPEWAPYYDLHYASVKRAIDYLVVKKDNIMTEGQQTFEDGMLSCSASQISMFALLQTDPALRDHYTEAAHYMINKHRVLDQSIIPDSRMNGGSIRFWEAQYDVLETKKWNFINSPHGWSAWHIYGLWYMYLLTGDEEFLLDTKNAINTCVQLIDGNSGELRWAFVVDPYCEVEMLRPSSRVGYGEKYDTVIGEQYVGMVRNYNYNEDPKAVLFGMPRSHGWSCDNDVNEIFKCMEEVCLTSAYVLEREDGSLITWNCTVATDGGKMNITPTDTTITGVHVNLSGNWNVAAALSAGTQEFSGSGICWIGQDNSPRLTHTPEPETPRILRDGYN